MQSGDKDASLVVCSRLRAKAATSGLAIYNFEECALHHLLNGDGSIFDVRVDGSSSRGSSDRIFEDLSKIRKPEKSQNRKSVQKWRFLY